MKQIKETADYRLQLDLMNESYVKTPSAWQRGWVVHKLLRETVWDLEYLHNIAPCMVPGNRRVSAGSPHREHDEAAYEGGHLRVGGQTVMEGWQTKLMERLAEIVTRSHGNVLEVGFGLGLSATAIQKFGVRSHTIVECSSAIVERFSKWKTGYGDATIQLIEGKWQDRVDRFGQYDGILFDIYPLTKAELLKAVIEDVTLAQQFFGVACSHLAPGGVFTYFTGELDSLSRQHQRLLLKQFSSVTISIIDGLSPQQDSEIWWAPTMAIVEARR
jgi:guanidinoacetate N-methyltransferase